MEYYQLVLNILCVTHFVMSSVNAWEIIMKEMFMWIL